MKYACNWGIWKSSDNNIEAKSRKGRFRAEMGFTRFFQILDA